MPIPLAYRHPSHRAALNLTLLFCCILSLTGCGWLRHAFHPRPAPDNQQAASPVATPAPFIPSAIQKTLNETTTPTLPADARGQNPMALGPSAAIAVGRTFTPIAFDPGSAELNSEARRLLTEHAAWLRAHPHVWIVLAGHTSWPGPLAYNYNFGMQRAITVQKFLAGQSLDARKLYPISFGPELSDLTSPADIVEVLGFIPPAGTELPPAVPGSGPAPDEQTPAETGTQRDIPPPEIQ